MKPVAHKNKAWEKHHASSSSVGKDGPRSEGATWTYHLQVSPHTAHHTEALFSLAKKIYGKRAVDPMDDLDVNLDWTTLLCSCVTMRRRGAILMSGMHMFSIFSEIPILGSYSRGHNFWTSFGSSNIVKNSGWILDRSCDSVNY